MRKILIAIAFLSMCAFAGSDFSNGYAAGYKAGYTYQCGTIAPITPITPIPDIGEDTFQGGYNKGFIDGLRNNPCK